MALFNASLTGGSGGDSNLVLSSTLVAGQTTLVITDERITSESVLDDIYTSIFGMKVKSAVINEGNVTIEFPVQEENMEVSVSLNIGTDKEIIGNGKSAYQYAVDGGFEGTEAEFVELMGDVSNLDSIMAEMKEEIMASVSASVPSMKWKSFGKIESGTVYNLPSEFNELLIFSGNGYDDILILGSRLGTSKASYSRWVNSSQTNTTNMIIEVSKTTIELRPASGLSSVTLYYR